MLSHAHNAHAQAKRVQTGSTDVDVPHDWPLRIHYAMQIRSRLFRRTCMMIVASLLAACSSPKPLYQQEQFDATSSPYTRTFHQKAAPPADAPLKMNMPVMPTPSAMPLQVRSAGADVEAAAAASAEATPKSAPASGSIAASGAVAVPASNVGASPARAPASTSMPAPAVSIPASVPPATSNAAPAPAAASAPASTPASAPAPGSTPAMIAPLSL